MVCEIERSGHIEFLLNAIQRLKSTYRNGYIHSIEIRDWPRLRMQNKITFGKVEETVLHDENFRSTMLSYLMVLLVFINASVVHSPVIGIAASSLYFLTNAIFLGNIFFERETPLSRFMLGSLLLIVFLGLIGLTVMMIYNLDAIRSAIVLLIVATFSSLMYKMTEYSISIELTTNRSGA